MPNHARRHVSGVLGGVVLGRQEHDKSQHQSRQRNRYYSLITLHCSHQLFVFYGLKLYHKRIATESSAAIARVSLLFGKYPYAAVTALRPARTTCLHRNKRVVGDGIHGNAVGVSVGGYILQPQHLDGVDHA